MNSSITDYTNERVERYIRYAHSAVNHSKTLSVGPVRDRYLNNAMCFLERASGLIVGWELLKQEEIK